MENYSLKQVLDQARAIESAHVRATDGTKRNSRAVVLQQKWKRQATYRYGLIYQPGKMI